MEMKPLQVVVLSLLAVCALADATDEEGKYFMESSLCGSTQ